jgi:hypothetical protein
VSSAERGEQRVGGGVPASYACVFVAGDARILDGASTQLDSELAGFPPAYVLDDSSAASARASVRALG